MPVEGVAVQQHQGHARRLGQLDQAAQQQRVGAAQVQVPVAESDVQLDRQSEVRSLVQAEGDEA